MCHFQTLYHHEQIGYVIRCLGCDHFQVGFGNLLLTLDQTDFSGFLEVVRKWKEEPAQNANPETKSIVIPTPCEGIKLFLTGKELADLHQMLETADTECRSREILSLFDITASGDEK